MRAINIGTKNYTEIFAMDEPEFNANHEYAILHAGEADNENEPVHTALTAVNFQKGPIKENGVNGCHHEDLIAIVIDRLQSFQKSSFKCVDNELAIKHLEDALWSLNNRTKNRKERGVEGTSVV